MQRSVRYDRMEIRQTGWLMRFKYTYMVPVVALWKGEHKGEIRRFWEDQTILGQHKTRSVAYCLRSVLNEDALGPVM